MRALDDAGGRVAEIERRWAQVLEPERFQTTCLNLQELFTALTLAREEAADVRDAARSEREGGFP